MATEKSAHAGEPGTGVVKTSGFKNFDEFFPFYMREHSNMICRRLHGTVPRVLRRRQPAQH